MNAVVRVLAVGSVAMLALTLSSCSSLLSIDLIQWIMGCATAALRAEAGCFARD